MHIVRNLTVLSSNPVQRAENIEMRESLYVHILILVFICLSWQTVSNFTTMHNTNCIQLYNNAQHKLYPTLQQCTTQTSSYTIVQKGKHDDFHSSLIKSALLLSYGQHMSCWVHRFTKTTSFSTIWTVMIPVSPTGCVMSTQHILQQHRILSHASIRYVQWTLM